MNTNKVITMLINVLYVLSIFCSSIWSCSPPPSCWPPCGPCSSCVWGQCSFGCGTGMICTNGGCVPANITFVYDSVGNRISMTDTSGTTSYSYDYLGRLTSVTNPNNKTISYQYDASGNRTQMTDPSNNITTYSYDDDNRLEEVETSAGSTIYQYDSFGRQTRVDYPNGTYTEYTYHPQRHWLTSVTNKDSSDATLSSYTYTYDDVGNRLTVTEADSSLVTYQYDDIYQLTSEARTGTNAYSITYQYDDVGNRTQMIKNAATTTYTYNNDNQLTAELTNGVTTAYNYDNNGNLTSKAVGGSTTTYAWDWRNMLVSVTESAGTTVYQYDGAGNRANKTVSGVKTKYINDVGHGLTQVLMETDNVGVVQASYSYGNDLISMNRSGANSYYHYDGLGTTRQMTNSTGAVVASYTYDGFGNVIASSGSVANTYGFTGEQQFAEADNLVYLRARYYSPSYGRFMSRDPIGYRGGLNLYAYVKNNPVRFRDPSGLLGYSPWPGHPPISFPPTPPTEPPSNSPWLPPGHNGKYAPFPGVPPFGFDEGPGDVYNCKLSCTLAEIACMGACGYAGSACPVLGGPCGMLCHSLANKCKELCDKY